MDNILNKNLKIELFKIFSKTIFSDVKYKNYFIYLFEEIH